MKKSYFVLICLALLNHYGAYAEENQSNVSTADAPSSKRFRMFYQFSIRDLSDTSDAQQTRSETGTIMPTALRFDQHIFSLGYQMSPRWSLDLGSSVLKSKINLAGFVMIPIGPGQTMKQDISIDSGSQGWSDLRLSSKYEVTNSRLSQLFINQSLSFPTGSVTEKDQGRLLPYSGQLGSGTYDLSPSIEYSLKEHDQGGWTLNSDLTYVLRIGRSELNYRMGDQTILNLQAGYLYRRAFGLFAKGRLRNWQDSSDPRYANGQPADDPYVVGGTRWEALAVAKAALPLPGFIGALMLEGGLPFYQGQSGGEVQLESDWYLQSALAISI